MFFLLQVALCFKKEENGHAVEFVAGDKHHSPRKYGHDSEEACFSVVETAQEANLEALIATLNVTGLIDMLGMDFVGTVFAPVNEAFLKILERENLSPEEAVANIEPVIKVLPSCFFLKRRTCSTDVACTCRSRRRFVFL